MKKKKKEKKKVADISLQSVEQLVGEIRVILSTLVEDVIQPRKFVSDEIHLLVSRLKEVSNSLVSHFYQDEYELKNVQKKMAKYEDVFEEMKIELTKISTEMFPHSETIKRAYDLLYAKYDQIFREVFEDENFDSPFAEEKNLLSPHHSPMRKTPTKKKRKRRRSQLVTPERSRRVKTSDNNVFVEMYHLRQENERLKQENHNQLKRIRELELSISQREISGMIKVSREDAQEALVQKFQQLQEKSRFFEKDSWEKSSLIDELRRKNDMNLSKIRWLHRVVEKHSLRKKVLQRISSFESTRADLIKKQQSQKSDSLIASVIDEQQSRVFLTEESLIEEQRRRKRAEQRSLSLEVDLNEERETVRKLHSQLTHLRSQPTIYNYHQKKYGTSNNTSATSSRNTHSQFANTNLTVQREEVVVDGEVVEEMNSPKNRMLDSLYGGESPAIEDSQLVHHNTFKNTLSKYRPIQSNHMNINTQHTHRNKNEKKSLFSRSVQTHRVRWAESYVSDLSNLLKHMYFLDLKQRPDDQFLLVFLKLFKELRTIYRRLVDEEFLVLSGAKEPIASLLPEHGERVYTRPPSYYGAASSVNNNSHSVATSHARKNQHSVTTISSGNFLGFGNMKKRRGKRAKTASGGRKRRLNYSSFSSSTNNNIRKKKVRRPVTSFGHSSSQAGNGGRWGGGARRQPFQYYKSRNNFSSAVGRKRF